MAFDFVEVKGSCQGGWSHGVGAQSRDLGEERSWGDGGSQGCCLEEAPASGKPGQDSIGQLQHALQPTLGFFPF